MSPKSYKRKARHHGVEIDHADAFLRRVVQHHVIELRVVVRRPLRQHALGLQVDQPRGHRLAPQGEIDFRSGQFRAVRDIGLDRLFQGRETLGRIMEISDRIVQPRRGQVGQQPLKASERLRRLEGLRGRLDGVIGAQPHVLPA